jgi:rubrerythrin
MKELKGSRTEKNVLISFAGESQARNRYTYFASAAKKEGLELVSRTFLEIADQEKEHAKKFFNLLQGGEVEIAGAFPAGVVGKTADNLNAAAGGEKEEHTQAYPEMAKVADEEGFAAIASLFRFVSVAEREHERRFRALLDLIEKGRMFKREKAVKWRCLNCGFVHEGTDAPGACPACAHPQAYFEALN